MKTHRSFWQRFIYSPYAFFALLALALLLHAGNTLKGGLYADDYIHAALFTGEPALEQKGLLKGLGVGEPWALLSNQFNFFDPRSANYAALKEYGILPWWTSADAKLHFFRPLATATHLIDYALWPDNTHLMHAMNMLWYLLGLCMIFLCFRQLGVKQPIALLAFVFVILDVSTFHVTSWIASRSMLMLIALGFFCLFAYHKGVSSKIWYGLSLLLLGLSFLTAEGAIGICMYLAAYVLVFDERAWRTRFLAILPFALIAVVWRFFYINAGFGAEGLDFYVDPSNDLAAFTHRALTLYPTRFFELFSGIDVMSGQISLDIQKGFFFAGLALFILLVSLLWQPLRSDKTLRFFFVGAMLSLIPALTIALPSRTLLLPNIGFSVVMAFLFFFTCDKAFTGVKKILAWPTVSFLAFMHLLVALVVSLYMFSAITFSDQLDRGESSLPFDTANKHVVFLNAHKPFWLTFFAHEQASKQLPLPASLRILASDFHPMQVERKNKNTIILTADPGFQLDSQPLSAQTFSGHFSYLSMQLMGLLRKTNTPWVLNETHSFNHLSIRVTELINGKPKALEVIWEDDMPFLWVAWSQKRQQYEEIQLPDINTSIQLGGTL